MGLPFYMVMRATQRSRRLQCKGSSFITQLFSNTLHEHWSGPWNPPPPTLQSSAVPTELILPKLHALIDLIYYTLGA